MFALVQEPYLGGDEMDVLPEGMRVFTDRRGKAAILVDHQEAICMPVETLTTDYGVCLVVKGSFGSIFLCAAYCQFDAPLEPYLRYMDAVLLQASRTPAILGLDANAVSPMWLSKLSRHAEGQANYRRGELLSEWMLEARVAALNQSTEVYTFDNHRATSDIDVTIVNEAASMWATYEWRVDEWELSDHNIITVVAEPTTARAVESIAPVPSWNFCNARWRLFKEEMVSRTAELPENFSESPLDQQVSTLRSIVHSVCDIALGRKLTRSPSRRARWWTADLCAARREVRRLRRLLQDGRRRDDDAAVELVVVELRRASANYKKLIGRAKMDDWKRFVGDHADDPWGRVYKICRGRRKCTEIGCLRVNGELITDWGDCARVLLRNFFPVAESEAPTAIAEEVPPALEVFEVDTCVARLKSRRSPGLDGINGTICKAVWRAIPEHLASLFSRCIRLGYFPAEWKCPRVVSLLKGPDKDKCEPSSYRGICLLPVFGKVLEAIMVNRVREVLPEGCRWQFGFRQGRCVEDAWRHVKSSVGASPAQYVLGTFVDFKGAFDNVEWSAALCRLADLGCREMGLWQSFFSGRRAVIRSSSGTVDVPVTRGCPQGSISGPFIWDILMDVLLQRLQPYCQLSAYADDLLLLVEGNSRAVLEEKGAQLMSIVETWGAEVGVAVSTSKTVIMLLKGALRRAPTVRFAGANLPYVRSCRYLGITVSEGMKFLTHIASLRQRMTGVVGALARVLRADWGFSPRARRTIYDGLMAPCVLFGAPVWYDTAEQVAAQRRLASCQRLILLGCLSVCRTVSTVALQVLGGAPPLDLAAKLLAVKYKLKRGFPLEENDWLYGEDIACLSWEQRKTRLEECLIQSWQNRWDDDSEPGRVTHRFIPYVTLAYRDPSFGFSMRTSFLLTGHGSFNAFLHGRALSDTTACACGDPYEDWMHILCACPLYADLRDLDGLGVQRLGENWIFERILDDQEKTQRLAMFAEEVFLRRRGV